MHFGFTDWLTCVNQEPQGDLSDMHLIKRVPIAVTLTLTLSLILSCGALVSAQTLASNNSRLVSDSALPRLEREIARLAKGAGGVVGVTAIHLETNRRVSLNGADRFPMASTYKVPIAVQLLTRVDKGELRLDQMVQFQPNDLHPGSGTLTELFNNLQVGKVDRVPARLRT
jgi:beta-lactamase class A